MQCVQEVEDNAVLFRQTGIIPALEYGIYNLTLCSHHL